LKHKNENEFFRGKIELTKENNVYGAKQQDVDALVYIHYSIKSPKKYRLK